jgi:predicted aldo/keto reductase-like oxidoreductase
MHALDDPQYLDPEYIKMGEALRTSGKTRYFGFSCHGGRVVELMNKAAEVGGIDAIMFRFSFARYGDLELNKAIDACKKASIGLIAMKTQDSVPADQEEVAGFESRNFNLAQAKLKAVWADERIDSAVSHMDNTKKLAENVEAAKSPVQLSMSEIQQLRRIARATAEYSCQGCSRICESRVEGEVRVADTLRFLMYHEAYGEPEKARKLYRELRPEERASRGVDFRAASAACPQGIDIARRLEHARRTLSA